MNRPSILRFLLSSCFIVGSIAAADPPALTPDGSVPSQADLATKAYTDGSNIDPAAFRTGLGVVPARDILLGSAAPIRAARMRADRLEDMSLAFVGDSTFFDTTNAGIPKKFADQLAATYTSHRVEFRISTADASSSTLSVLRAGTTRRHWYWGSGDAYGVFLPSADALSSPTAGDLRVECECAFEAGALTSGYPSSSTYLLGWGTSSNGFMRLAFVSNVLALYWSEDTAGTFRVASVTPPAITADAIVRWRADLDIDNGAAGRTVRFYYSTNSGSTWTQIGADVVQAGVTTIAAPAAYSFHLNTIGANTKTGLRIYDAQIYGGTIAAPVPLLPWRIDQWGVPEGVGTDILPALAGDPVIYIDVAAQNGASLKAEGFFRGSGAGDLPAESRRCLRNHNPDAVFITTSHNDVMESDKSWADNMDDALTKLLAIYPLDPAVVILTQNPEPLDYGFGSYSGQANRRAASVLSYAGRKRYTAMDLYEWMRAGYNAAHYQTANVHLTSAGYTFLFAGFWDCWLEGTNN